MATKQTFSLRFAVTYAEPAPAPGQLPVQEFLGEHVVDFTFECVCGEGERHIAEIAPDVEASAVRNVSVSQSSNLVPELAPRINMVPARVVVRRANCTDGPGIVVWVELDGQFNANPAPPPFEWRSWRVTSSWIICCCCDPFGADLGYCGRKFREMQGVADTGFQVVLEIDKLRDSCDDTPSRQAFLPIP